MSEVVLCNKLNYKVILPVTVLIWRLHGIYCYLFLNLVGNR